MNFKNEMLNFAHMIKYADIPFYSLRLTRLAEIPLVQVFKRTIRQ